MTLALKLAKMEGNVDTELVQLGALLHDIADWKYSGSEDEGPRRAREWLVSQNYDSEKTQKVIDIIEGIGFKSELGLTREQAIAKAERLPELAVVQDADRLDAIGAIGIARTFTFGGTRNTPLHDPTVALPDPQLLTKEAYMNRSKSGGSTIQHFYDKLLHLKDMMKTTSGKKLAADRHKYMEVFLEQFLAEWNGER
jgi:uncharacterized protein